MLYFLRDHHRRSESACRATQSWPRPENQKRRKESRDAGALTTAPNAIRQNHQTQLHWTIIV